MLEPNDSPRDLVVIGASVGGLEVLRQIAAGLPPEFPAAVCIVLHIAPEGPSALAPILGRAGPLPCHPARDGERLRIGEIVVAPPDRHLTVEDGRVRLTVGPRENGHRPAVDPLFRSAADAWGSRAIGVILSGTRDDGAAGLAAIKAAGGAAVVQDPEEALYAGMPASALAHVAVDAVAPADLIARTLVAMVNGRGLPPDVDPPNPPKPSDPSGEQVTTICPDCGGVLSERGVGGVTQWECRVGHRYSPESLADAQAEDVEAALWAAVRALEDRHALLLRMAGQAGDQGQNRSARGFRDRADAAGEHARAVRRVLGGAAATALRSAESPEDDESSQESVA